MLHALFLYCVAEPLPAGVGMELPDSELSQSQPAKQRAHTMGQPEQNHIEITKASLQSRPRPYVKNPPGTVFLPKVGEWLKKGTLTFIVRKLGFCCQK